MKKQNKYPPAEWSALYETAIDFKKLSCWKWTRDSDLFGVRDPETDEISYCCVMGYLKEVFALSVYLGAEGLNSYWLLHDNAHLIEEGSASGRRAMFNRQKCLMASFEDRSELHKRDLSLIRELGLKFRGKREWPMFRKYQPDFAPWFISPSEVRFLTIALRQTIDVAMRLKDNPALLDPPDKDKEQYLVRTSQKGKWRDVWLPPVKYISPPPPTTIIDEMLLARLKRSKFARGKSWVADCVVLPTVIGEGERPYYPYGFPVLSEDGMALGMELLKPEEVDRDLPNKFMELIQKIEIFPRSLTVGSKRIFDLLEPVAKKLKIMIEYSDRLPELEFFLNGMEEFFRSS